MSIDSYVHNVLLTGERGHFAATLGDAWTRADTANKEKLEESFPDIFKPMQSRRIEAVLQFIGRLDNDNEIFDLTDCEIRAEVEARLEDMARQWGLDSIDVLTKV